MVKTAKLCVTSDLHGAVFPTDYSTLGQQPMGLLCLAEQFQKDRNTLVLDCGDLLQGTPFSRLASQDDSPVHLMARVMNACGYDAVTLGNHDFNGGLEQLERYLTGLKAPCLCSNIRDKAGRLPLQSTAVITLENGLRVGLTGICTDYLRYWEDPNVVAQLELVSPLDAAGKALEELKDRCDVTVCLYHGGLERDLETGELLSDSGEDLGWTICQTLSFDILLTGHQHREIPGRELFGTWVLQPGCSGKCFAKVEIEVDDKGRVAVFSRLERPRLPLQSLPPIWLAKLEEKTQLWLDDTAAVLDRKLAGGDPLTLAFYGSPVAELINQMQLAVSGAEISATCLDQYRASMGPTVRRRDVLASYRFANTLKVIRITGALLHQYLERVASYFHTDGQTVGVAAEFIRPKPAHYNYDYLAGVEYIIDLSRPVGSRVVQFTRKSKPVKTDDQFAFCVTSYRAAGGGGYEFLRQCPVLWESGVEISQLLLEYLMERENVTVDCPCGLHIQNRKNWRMTAQRADGDEMG